MDFGEPAAPSHHASTQWELQQQSFPTASRLVPCIKLCSHPACQPKAFILAEEQKEAAVVGGSSDHLALPR